MTAWRDSARRLRYNPSMSPQQAAIELEYAIAQAIARYEREAPGGICIGVYVDRSPDGFKVKPRLKMKGPIATAPQNAQKKTARAG